ncbi:transmembrane protein, putative (macronuclear) [Tetrahymena thermophila SB210]|uniref:Transmembrane protein, putative n=1 Tax=Tetrahymena thermophila (strain SB210) TaxID=312017 RepID=I7MKF7_TETTS|nr:transmembrane protein, putative [Tetrahymena thermophila SB210]EAR98342.2 transmembrane protein, putative [Tetrahymena thermophila SB210]|eukprot:XP_001018587.2 transmembrane protein, putative [Tetrahymena thermophila SB210]
MNQISLCFQSQSLEQKFQEESRKTYGKIYVNILIGYIFIVAIPCVVISSINFNLNNLGIYIIAVLNCSFNSILTIRKPKYFNLQVNTLSFFIVLAFCGQIIFFGTSTGIDDDYFLFFFGACGISIQVTLAFLSANYLFTCTQMILSTMIYYYVFWSKNIYAFKYQYGAFMIFILYAVYIIQRDRRQIFLHQNSQKEWSQIVKQVLSSSIITVQYDQKNNLIELDMINNQAKKMLQINDSNEFKIFSRQTLAVDRLQDYSSDFQESKTSEIGDIIQNKNNMWMSNVQKNTVENRIISLIKEYIEKKHKKQKSSQQKYNQKYSMSGKKEFKNEGDNNTHIQFEEQTQDFFYGIYKKNDCSKDQVFSIKVSAYQNFTSYYCCLVIERETEKQKIQALKKINSSLEKCFFQLFINIGDKLQNISNNLQNKDVINSNILQSYNQMYNYKDHALIIKNEFKLLNGSQLVQNCSLGKFNDIIKRSFLNKLKEVKLNFSYVNCDENTEMCTQSNKLRQILMNLIENSIKFFNEQTTSKRKYSYLQNIFKRKKNFTLDNQKTININSKQLEQNNANQINKSDNLTTTTKNIQQDFNLDLNQSYAYQITSQYNSQLKILQLNEQNQSQVNISFQLIKGENAKSNIIKISVLDNSGGISLKKLYTLLELIGTKNPAFNSKYLNYNFIGWKVNYHIIGNLGPFFNFFVRTLQNQGLEYHFYIFQNIEILFEKDQKYQTVFSNNAFQENMENSHQEYYHIQNYTNLKQYLCENQMNHSKKIKRMQTSCSINYTRTNINNHQKTQNNNKLPELSKENIQIVDQSLKHFEGTQPIINTPKYSSYQLINKINKQADQIKNLDQQSQENNLSYAFFNVD